MSTALPATRPLELGRAWITPATLLALSSLTVMAGATVAPALPALRAHFAGSVDVDLMIRLVLTLPALAIAIAAPVAGYAIDRWGRRPLITVAIFLYAIAGTGAFVLDSLIAILATRVMLGAAVAFIMTGATALIADFYDGAARARFMGLQAASMSGGGVVFLLLGGVLADVSWRAPFLVYLIALATLPGLASLVEPSRLASHETGAHGRQSVTPGRVPRALLAILYAIALLGMILFYLTPTQIPFLVRQHIGASAFLGGVALAATTLTGAAASLSFGRVRARLSPPAIVVCMFALLGVGYLLVGRADGYATILAGLAIAGLGVGLLLPNLTSWLTTVVPVAMRGRAVGGLTTAIFLGQFASPLVSQPIAERIGLAALFALAGVASLLIAAGLALRARFAP